MKDQTSGYRLTKRHACRLAGALGLLLALCLVAGGVMPAYAGPPPTMPHAFYGDVTVNSAPVANGTPVAAYVNGAWAVSTTVAGGIYSLDVPGTAGALVTFRVGGAPANEPATTWQSGALTNLDLTITDTAAPADPTNVVGDRAVSTWSKDNTVTVTWTDSVDTGGSGLDGYSILWDTTSNTVPAATKNIENGVQTTTSAALADGNSHYFHIRAVDNAGNWVSTVHLGPFWIDTTPAPAPTVVGAATNAAGTVITITFSKNMADPAGKHDEFKYQIGGGADQNFSAAALNADNTKVDLTCAGTAIAYGNTVTVSYTKGTVLATDSGVLESFTNQAVTNNMPSPELEKLIGADDATPVGGYTSGALILFKCQAIATGDVTEIRVKGCGTGTTFKIGIYADVSGSPTTLLGYNNTATASSAGWQAVSLNVSVAVTSGTYYWLGISAYGINAIGYTNDTCTVKYKFTPGDMPSPAGTGYYDNAVNVGLIAGWGGTVALVAPAAPTRDCSALTFKWNASAGATNYHLQVNTSADFTGTNMFNGEVGNVTSREVTGLTGNTTYYYRIKAGNAGGWSGWSSTGSMRCGDVPG